MQVWLGAHAGLGCSAAVPVMARSFWDAQSTHVLCCVKASGPGVILVSTSRTAGSSRLVRLVSGCSSSLELSQPALHLWGANAAQWLLDTLDACNTNACAAQVLDQQQLPWSDKEGLPVHACAWCPSGKHAAISLSSGQAAGSILVVDTALQLLHQVQLRDAAARADSLAFDPSGAVLAYVSCQQLCWDYLPGKLGAVGTASAFQLAALRSQAGTLPMTQVSWSCDGSCLLAGKQKLFRHLPKPACGMDVMEGLFDPLLACLHPAGKGVLRANAKPANGQSPPASTQQPGNASGHGCEPQLEPSWSEEGAALIAVCYHPTGKAWAVLFNHSERAWIVVGTETCCVLQRVCLGLASEQVLAKSTPRLAWSASGDALRIVLTDDKAVTLTWGGAATNYSRARWRIRLAPAEFVTAQQALWEVCEFLAYQLCAHGIFAVLWWLLGIRYWS